MEKLIKAIKDKSHHSVIRKIAIDARKDRTITEEVYEIVMVFTH